MKDHNLDHSQSGFANQDLHQLLQHGRTLHDRAIFDLLYAFVAKLSKKFLATAADDNQAGYHVQRKAPYSN